MEVTDYVLERTNLQNGQVFRNPLADEGSPSDTFTGPSSVRGSVSSRGLGRRPRQTVGSRHEVSEAARPTTYRTSTTMTLHLVTPDNWIRRRGRRAICKARATAG